MIEVLERARALRALLEGTALNEAESSLVEAAIACTERLIEIGRAQLAADLVEPWMRDRRALYESPRFAAVVARALLATEQYDDAFKLITETLRQEARGLGTNERFLLRIYEAACLRAFSRVEESARSLAGLRVELLNFPDSRILGWCTYQLGSAELMRGARTLAKRLMTESLVSAQRSGDRYLEASALHVIAIVERHLCRWSAAVEAAEGAIAIFEASHPQLPAAHAVRSTAMIALRCGRLDEASRRVEQYLEALTALDQQDQIWGWYGVLVKGMVLLHEGKFAETTSLLGSNPRWQAPNEHSRASLLTTEFLGDVHLEQGHAEPALALYDAVFPKALALVPKGDIVAELRRRRAECYLLLNRPQAAYDEAKVGLEHCRDLGDRYEEAATYRILALSSAALGNAAEAKRWFDQGFAYYDDIETPYEWGKLWMAYGDWLRGPHAGEFADMAAGLEAYQAARDHFDRMGAHGKLAEAEARIAAATGRTAKPTAKVVREKATPRRRPRGSSELERKSQWAFDTFGMLTANKSLLRMLDDVAKLAKTSSPLLVLGESGTGKELVATAVHQLSGRTGTYLPINCSSLPREVIESELFGHAQGAFTGAARDKAGLLEVCAGGTAFLDEIGEMSLELQSRLLRFLETGELRRVGATRNLRIDTRIVAATNRGPAELEAGDGFRQDLYYRLAHAVVVLPPLRQRGDDIELLAHHFLESACVEQGKEVVLSEEAVEALRAHRWPGNVRELKAVMKRVVILSPGDHVVTVSDLALKPATAPSTLLEELAHSEREKIAAMLKHVAGSRTEAARALGIPRTTLLNKIRRYGLS